MIVLRPWGSSMLTPKNSVPIRLASLDVSEAVRWIPELGETPPPLSLCVQRKSGFHRRQGTLSRSAHLCDASQAGKVPPKQACIQLCYQKQTNKTKTPSRSSAWGWNCPRAKVIVRNEFKGWDKNCVISEERRKYKKIIIIFLEPVKEQQLG